MSDRALFELVMTDKDIALRVVDTVGYTHVFKLDLSTDVPSWAILLLRRALYEQFRQTMETIRKQAYERGWRDAKAKRAKATWFSSWVGYRESDK